ncbi:cation-translocating P-type ATPase [Pelodictyon luteolum]|uniref:ATPase, E1-E2 type n=1 Tax=Chlorobium luteolum (strain DSM 273 / BCRC 81028 / 2530) TaxID=319225 RepID=Q3B3I5_CHLL3|nr:cation-translocating P-type ATPase [Pelodictyon luteolum]ABB24096.1 ATPase, E1-E2 type [Pelodictyon luteolum DSM 273]
MHSDSRVPWHALPADEAMRRLDSGPDGLTHDAVLLRKHKEGANIIRPVRPVRPLSLLLLQFRNVLVITLFIAAALSFLIGEGLEAATIAIIVLFAVVLGFVQEYRAEQAVAALRKMAAPMARVRRGGRESTLDASELVSGDIIILDAGDRVPADARIFSSYGMIVDESPLTGESEATEKSADSVFREEAVPGDRLNMVFAGTTIRAGRGEAVVTATGMQTEFGRIASLLGEVPPERTPLQKNLDRVGILLSRAALLIVLFIVVSGLLHGRPFMEMVLFGIALAVAVVPEALPAVVTISLALGVQRMARRNALMRRLPVVETLGSTTVICTDKTGTLTRDEMTVRRIRLREGEVLISGTGYLPEGTLSVAEGSFMPDKAKALLLAAVLCNDAGLEMDGDGIWTVAGDPTEGALVVAARKAGIDEKAERKRCPRIGEIPFSSETRRMLTLHRIEGKGQVFMKGAPEAVLRSCSAVSMDGASVPFDDALKTQMQAAADLYGSNALRVLGFARRDAEDFEGAETGMTFLGLAAMIDPPRPEAGPAVRRCIEAGIRPVMITGDHPLTAAAIAKELGFPGDGRVVSGAMLKTMDEGALCDVAASVSVFARVSPEHKLRLVEALQKNGEVVAMTGDGVNDAPALKRADIGISMGITGTDVAREASAMTLTDDNFSSIVDAIEEGRGIYDNIRKYLTYLLSSNIGELGLIVGAMLLGLPMPLTAVQILYVNLATDGLPALALGVDPPEEGIMRRPPADPKTGVFTPPLMALMLAGGLWSTLCNLLLFTYALHTERSVGTAMTMTFVSLVLIEFFKAYNFRSLTASVFRRPFANRWLNLAVLWESCMFAAVLFVPLFEGPFGVVRLEGKDWILTVLPALSVLPVLELVKLFIRKNQPEAA